eukprot:scpid91712/ scgid16761/ 
MAQPVAPAPAVRQQPLVIPEKFSGKLSDNWPTWLAHFQQVAAFNLWTPAQQVQYMGLALTGDAQLFYQSLPVATRQGAFAPLSQALAARFAPPQRASLHRAEFKVLRQGSQASLSSYCEAVRHAAVLAYPQMPGQDRDILAKDQFVAGLECRAVRIQVFVACCVRGSFFFQSCHQAHYPPPR